MTEKRLEEITTKLHDAQFGYSVMNGPTYYKDVKELLEDRAKLVGEIARLQAKLPPEPTEGVG